MEIVSLDIETTGTSLDSTNQILEVGAVIFNTKDITAPSYDNNSTFKARINYEFLSGNPFALNMNKQLIEDLVTYQKHRKAYEAGTLTDQDLIDLCGLYIEPEELTDNFLLWLQSNGVKGSINMAGKNPGIFDHPFLNSTIPQWSEYIKVKRRFIDPAILYVDNETDELLPNLEQCKERSGLFENNKVSHFALDDALDVALLVWDKLKTNKEYWLVQTNNEK